MKKSWLLALTMIAAPGTALALPTGVNLNVQIDGVGAGHWEALNNVREKSIGENEYCEYRIEWENGLGDGQDAARKCYLLEQQSSFNVDCNLNGTSFIASSLSVQFERCRGFDSQLQSIFVDDLVAGEFQLGSGGAVSGVIEVSSSDDLSTLVVTP